MKLKLTAEEKAMMKAYQIRFGVSAEEIATAFISDLCRSTRTRGSDERIQAMGYVQRAFGDRIEYGSGEPITEAEVEKMWNYESQARKAAERELSERREHHEARQRAQQEQSTQENA